MECERSGAHLEIPYLFLLTDCECNQCGTRKLSTKVFPLRRAQNDAGMAGSTTESVGASTAEIFGVFGRGVVENECIYVSFFSLPPSRLLPLTSLYLSPPHALSPLPLPLSSSSLGIVLYQYQLIIYLWLILWISICRMRRS